MKPKPLVPPLPGPDLASRGVGVGAWWWDVASDALEWDEGMRRLFGLSAETTVVRYEDFLARVHGDDRDAVQTLVGRAIEEGADYEAAFRICLPDGAQRVVAARGVAYLDADGAPARMVGVCWDGTARHQAEEELRRSEARYRGLVESQQDLVFRFDLAERVTFANDAYCAKFGLRREDLLGHGLTHLHPDDRAATTAAIQQLLAPPHQGMIENRVRTPEGWRVVSWSGCAIADEKGTVAEIQCVGRDVTERRIAEENLQASNGELRESQERLRSLAHRIAAVREDERRRLGLDLHDGVCQDLVGVALLVGSLRQRGGPTTEEGVQLERIERHLHGVVDHLRRLARDLRPMLLHDLGLAGSIGSLVGAFSSDTVRVTARFGGAVPRLAENVEIGVYRVVQEAVTNACRHGAPTEVCVSLEVGESVRLEVRDDGIGFDPAGGRAHAFGLVSMEERALALSGRLTVESAPGQGTVLRFECPARRPSA